MPVLKVAIAGFGGVGRATANLLLTRRTRYRQVYQSDVRLVAVCGSRSGLADAGGLEPERLDWLEPGLSGPEFIEASGADILTEAGPSDFRTGGPGLAYIHSSLTVGRDAIVISKGALVHSGAELRALARSSGAMLKLSGAAGAALPTIDLLEQSLKGCEVLEIEGILNATTNYLLDAMMNEGLGFDDALGHAQARGFAEADPRNDTEGWDTASKLLILANFGLDAGLTMDDLTVEGIGSITEQHIVAWREERLVPKLVGSFTRADGAIRAFVGVRTYPLTACAGIRQEQGNPHNHGCNGRDDRDRIGKGASRHSGRRAERSRTHPDGQKGRDLFLSGGIVMNRRSAQAVRHIGFEDLGCFDIPLRRLGYDIEHVAALQAADVGSLVRVERRAGRALASHCSLIGRSGSRVARR